MTEHVYDEETGLLLPNLALIASHTTIMGAARRRKSNRIGVVAEAGGKAMEPLTVGVKEVNAATRCYQFPFSFSLVPGIILSRGACWDENGDPYEHLTDLGRLVCPKITEIPGVLMIAANLTQISVQIGLPSFNWPETEEDLFLIIWDATGLSPEAFNIIRPDKEESEATQSETSSSQTDDDTEAAEPGEGDEAAAS